MTDCPFCNATVSDVTFMESPRFRAIVNIAPILPGHSLIVPKRHIESLLALSDEEVAEMVNLSRKAVTLLMRVHGATGFDWTIQESAAAGQSVPHLHLHLIPRQDGDLPDPGDWYTRLIDFRGRPRLAREEMKQLAERLREAGRETTLLKKAYLTAKSATPLQGAGERKEYLETSRPLRPLRLNPALGSGVVKRKT
ncbi:MAG TPA: HIT family protein [Anaerolineae bacterium]